MIIECISCQKKFSLNDALMPLEGSKVRCGSCSEVWFYHPVKEDLDSTTTSENEIENYSEEELETAEIEPNEENIEIEEEKTPDFKIFTDESSEPSKEEMDKNLDKYIIERDNNLGFFAKLFKKDRLKESAKALQRKKIYSEEQSKADSSRRTRLLFYLLIVLCIAASVLLVPIKKDIITVIPFLEGYITFLEPIYYHSVQNWLKF